MTTLLNKLQNAAKHGEDLRCKADESQSKADAKLEAQAKAQFLECQKIAMSKLSKGNFYVRDGYRRVVIMSESVHFQETPLTDIVERLFNSEGVKTNRCYGGDELYVDCELILLIPV